MARNDGYDSRPEPSQEEREQWAPPPAEAGERHPGTLSLLAQTYLDGAGLDELAGLVPPGIDQVRVVNAYLAAVKESTDLQGCTYDSLTAGLVDCARLGLWPGPQGHVYLIPYGGAAKAIIGYQGLAALMRRQGVSHVDTAVVYSEEDFTQKKGSMPCLDHSPITDDEKRGDPIAFYAVAHFEDGSPPAYEVMTLAEVEEIRVNHGNATVWDAHPREMARKTVLRRLAKWVGTDDAIGHAFDVMDRDGVVKTQVGGWDNNDTKSQIRGRMGLDRGGR